MATAVITKPTFTLADRLRIQQERAKNREFVTVGRLTAVVFEAPRSISGLSQSRPRYMNSNQAKAVPDSLTPFSEKQTLLWYSTTLDWLTHKNAPILAVSRDQHDLLLPYGMTPLPDLPDPRWTPKRANDVPPRIAQLLTGCPVVGDRVHDKLTARDGRVLGVIHPVNELCVILAGAQNPGGTFAKIKGGTDPADGTKLAMLIDDSDPNQMQAYFVGGRFHFGN